MSRFNIGHQGLEVETREKDNVMTSGVQIAFIFVFPAVILMIFPNILWVNILGALIFILCFIGVFSVYITHNIKNPELLQSEKYRLEKQKIEAAMFDNKNNNLIEQQMDTTNLLVDKNIKDSEDMK